MAAVPEAGASAMATVVLVTPSGAAAVVVDVQAVGDGLAGALAVADVALDQHRLAVAVGDPEGGAVGQVVQRVGVGEGERGVGVVIEQGELGERVGLCGQEGAA